MGWVRHVTVALCVAILVISTPARAGADIAAFNAAIQAKDYVAAAAAAREIWPQFDRTSPDTALIAREFGFASYVAGDFGAARDYGIFLVEQGTALPTPDDQPWTSLVLLRAAEYRLNASSSSRAALAQALTARLNAPDVDAISILAAEAYYRSEWASGNWTTAVPAADTAAQLLQRAGGAYKLRELTAQTIAAVAAFMRGQSRDDYIRMADVHDRIVEEIDRASSQQVKRELIDLKFQANAWVNAMEARFNSEQQTGSNIPRGVRARVLKRPSTFLFEGNSPENACHGRINAKEIRYPDSALFRGFNGSVIVRLSFNEQGSVTDHEILAAVPMRTFAADVDRQASKFRMTRLPTDAKNCSLAIKNYVLAIVFQIG